MLLTGSNLIWRYLPDVSSSILTSRHHLEGLASKTLLAKPSFGSPSFLPATHPFPALILLLLLGLLSTLPSAKGVAAITFQTFWQPLERPGCHWALLFHGAGNIRSLSHGSPVGCAQTILEVRVLETLDL